MASSVVFSEYTGDGATEYNTAVSVITTSFEGRVKTSVPSSGDILLLSGDASASNEGSLSSACAQFQLTVYSTVALISSFADLDLDGLEEEEEEDDGEIFSERFPDAPIYNDGFQKVLGDTRDRLRELHETLATCFLTADPQSALRSLSNQTKKLSEYQYPKTRVVGLVGESGVGELSQTTSL
jgi:hypothetical protein